MTSSTVDVAALEAKINYTAMRDVVGGSITTTLLATIFVGLHVGIKRYQRRSLAIESWLFLACLVCSLRALCCLACRTAAAAASFANAGQSRSYMVSWSALCLVSFRPFG